MHGQTLANSRREAGLILGLCIGLKGEAKFPSEHSRQPSGGVFTLSR